MTPLRIGFCGAAGTVTGSRYVVESGAHRLLVDCGLFQGYKLLRLRNWAAPQFDAASIDAVILTHAHIDHSGYLPRLIRQGFRGPVYCSRATLELCRVLLPDSGSLHEEDARYANKKGFSRHHPALPLYTRAEAEAALQQFEAVSSHTMFEPMPGMQAELRNAGHILGASFVRLAAAGTSITFSGDLGRPDDALMNPPDAPAQTDYLVVESTYGDRRHPVIDAEGELGGWLRKCIARGGVTVIPGFAVGRAQSLLWHIAELKRRELLPDVPVYVDSPMATDATMLYRTYHRAHRLDEAQTRRMCRAATFTNGPEESKALDQQGGPLIIISASGMATGGRVLHHLKAFAGDPRNLILFAGFQAPGTRGAALVGGARRVRIHGQEFSVNAEVAQLEAASSHADADEILAWMRQLPAAPRQVFVTHGEPVPADTLRSRIEHELGWRASVPEYRDFVTLAES
jgi:metallo-beta-lactamase family protein